MIQGIGVSPGIAIGKVRIIKQEKITVDKYNIDNINEEIKRFEQALEKTIMLIKESYINALKKVGQNEAEIFEAHQLMLSDDEFTGRIKEIIQDEKVNSEWAVLQTKEEYIKIFSEIDNDYLRERTADIEDISNDLIKVLKGIESEDISSFENVIIIANELAPSEVVLLDKTKINGIITQLGGATSHFSILAKSVEIPTIVSASSVMELVNENDTIIMDGQKGVIIINPSETMLNEYIELKNKYINNKKRLKKLIGQKSKTLDGFNIEIAANIASVEDIDRVIQNDAEGIGLFRTEFLFMESKPSEEKQFEAYKKIATKMKGKSIIIRTLDIGGDKEVPYLNLPKEDNPFLGYRAIRICLDRINLFKEQLRALLRASVFGNIKIMFPMICTVEELRQAKEILEEVKNELTIDNIPYNPHIQVGMMIETPSAAIMSDLFAKEVDFFSIGTNDLIQYTMAVDRMNSKVSYLYNPYIPSILRTIKNIVDNAHKENIWVGMCGNLAGDSELIPILIGIGLDELSMDPSDILQARELVNNTSKELMEKIVKEIVNMATADEIKEYIKLYQQK